ncbi:Hypothetical predicted protein [Octopus vulgaris]|uniref:Uncharacterized protein n=1 Tax=Octopus vulgaris TaxID=6645 RepID=A0AA36FM91_OCTVU|nr:Hypothetical predicted protein [Octopus vulgaris]
MQTVHLWLTTRQKPITRRNSRDDRRQPCLTPVMMLQNSVPAFSSLTAASVGVQTLKDGGIHLKRNSLERNDATPIKQHPFFRHIN